MKKITKIPDPGERIAVCFSDEAIDWIYGGIVSVTKSGEDLISWHICA